MKNRKLLRAAAALLLVGVVGVASVGCSFELEQPEWVTQALCDHVFDEEEVLKEATCTEDGKIQKTCSDCGKTKITTVKATGHDVVEDEAVDATCTTPGLTAGSHCTACGEVLVKQEEVTVDHTYGEWTVDVAATCTTEGSQKRVCSVCGETETEAIPVVSHVDATADGTCDVCNTALTTTGLNVEVGDVYAGEPIAGNFYRVYRYQNSDGTYDQRELYLSNLEGNLDYIYIDLPSGTYKASPFIFINSSPTSVDSVLVFYEAEYIDFYFESRTYTAVGRGSFTVTDETRFIDYGDLEIHRLNVSESERCLLGAHSFAGWITTVEPTCTTTGEETRTCTLCGEQQSQSLATVEHLDIDKDCSCDECDATLPETMYYREVREYDGTTDTVTGHWWRVYYIEDSVEFRIIDGAIKVSCNKTYGVCFTAVNEFGTTEIPRQLSDTNIQYYAYENYVDIYFDSSKSYTASGWSDSYTVSETAIFEIDGDFSIYLIEP